MPEADIFSRRSSGRLLGEAALSVYGAAGHVATPVAGALLRWREGRGKEDPDRRGERLGITGRVRPEGPLIWVHAASVGETLAALPLVGRLTARGPSVLLTTGTMTAAEIARRHLPAGTIHQFVPIDTPAAVAAFLDHWRPGLVLFAESEFWPTILRALERRAVPLAVVNARMSDRSFRAWRAFSPVAGAILGRVDLFLAQTASDAERLRLLGARRTIVPGNMKFDVPAPGADEAVVAEMRRHIGDRPVLVAASTHPGEEARIVQAHCEASLSAPRLLTIVAPRHPQRGDALAVEVGGAGLSVRRRSHGERIDRETDVFVADTIGEMGIWYRLADVAFLGGSMVPHGGQNPIEPAKLDVPILHGRHVGNFRDIYEALAEARAAIRVDDAASLAAAVKLLIADEAERARLAREARACVERRTGALERTLAALEPYLAELARQS